MKKTISIVLVTAVLFGMVTVFAAGTEADPLITKSYAEGVYRASFAEAINETGTKVAAEQAAINMRLDGINEQTGYNFARGFTQIGLGYHSSAVLLPGASFILSSGSGNIIYPSGLVINVSDGIAVSSGTELEKDKRYFCAENTTAVIKSMSTSTGFVDGYYKTEPFQTTLFVERLYAEVLGRRYDDDGLRAWVDRIVAGTSTVSEVARGFIFSAELTGRNLSNDDFVELLYRTILGRASDAPGKAYWSGQLGSGVSRQNIFNGFIVSAEWNQICKDYGLAPNPDSPVPVGTKVFVTRLYAEVLGRQPALSERNYWTSRIQGGTSTGSQAARDFLFSVELTARNLSNGDFIELLYRTMMGRPSDLPGKTHWVNELEKGTTRQKVFDGFVSSVEFAGICRIHGVQK